MDNDINQLIANIFYPYASNSLKKINKDGLKFAYYTNAETGFKIIDDESIWMRNIRCMNDYSEFKFGKDIIYNALDKDYIRERFNKLFAKLGRESFDIFFDGHVKGFIYGAQKRTYITCLSEHDINNEAEKKYGRLSMWRAYGGNSGVALILNTDFVENDEALGDRAFFITSPVLYEENVEKYLNEILDKLEHNFDLLKEYYKDMYMLVTVNLKIAIYVATLSIKHPAFKEEKEWRIILSFYNDSEVADLKKIVSPAYETIGGVPQKIYKINLKDSILHYTDVKSLLNQVLIGPTNDPDIIKEAFEGLIQRKHISITKDLVHKSSVPLRK